MHPLVKAFVWAGLLGGGVAFVAIPGFMTSSRASNAPYALRSLKTVASAQADFRDNDRDGNGSRDYWRPDIAGLYTLAPAGPGSEIKLIELSIAGADASPGANAAGLLVKAPKAGYWYAALSFPGEDPARQDPGRFAACAFPGSPAAGRAVFIVSHRNVVYKRRWNGPSDTPLVFPADPVGEGWEKMP